MAFNHWVEGSSPSQIIIKQQSPPKFGGLFVCKIKIMDGKLRKNIHAGLKVAIILKQDQRTGKLTQGIVKDLLTNSPNHPHGIKVRLTDGQVGRVQKIIS